MTPPLLTSPCTKSAMQSSLLPRRHRDLTMSHRPHYRSGGLNDRGIRLLQRLSVHHWLRNRLRLCYHYFFLGLLFCLFYLCLCRTLCDHSRSLWATRRSVDQKRPAAGLSGEGSATGAGVWCLPFLSRLLVSIRLSCLFFRCRCHNWTLSRCRCRSRRLRSRRLLGWRRPLL